MSKPILHYMKTAVVILLTAICFRSALADEAPPDSRLFPRGTLEGLPEAKQEKIREAAIKLQKIHVTVGDPGKGETSRYLDTVDELARFLKRGSVEEVRRLQLEARGAIEMVDRRWIDRMFELSRGETDAQISDAQLAKLDEQTAALLTVGELLHEAQAIPKRLGRLETAAERGYRNLIRLIEEGRRTFETIDHPPAQSSLQWLVQELDELLQTQIRPAHHRQMNLLSVYRKVWDRARPGREREIAKIFRTYLAKVRAIHRNLGIETD